MEERRFADMTALSGAAAELLMEAFRGGGVGAPTGVMLSGGRTPLEAYARVAASGLRAGPRVWSLFSDERMAPLNSRESNAGAARGMLDAVGVWPDRVLRVRGELAVSDAASRYDEALRSFLDGGGRIVLGFLGLGVDGHTASLFAPDDLARGAGGLAVAVSRARGPARVSVTPGLLSHVERIVFLVDGAAGKADVTSRMVRDPLSVVAGRAVQGCERVDVWVAGVG